MPKMSGSASADIDAPLAKVWEVVEDVVDAPNWQGAMDKMEPLERDSQGRVVRADTETDAKIRMIKTRVRFSYDEAPDKLKWTQEKGDLKSVEGAWILEDLGGDRTRATYRLDIDTGTVIGMLVRGPVEGRVRSLLVDNRPSELKKRVEGAA